MHTKITPFSEADIEEAADLLARRHQGDLEREPALPQRFTQSSVARVELEQTWNASNKSGVVARHNGRMLGYLIGVPKFGIWGRSVWVELAGHAIDRAYGAEIYRDLYAAISPSWVACGCLAHYALIPASDREAVDAWFNLSFGKEHVHAIRETAPASAFDVPTDSTLDIRRATPDDLDASLELDDILSIHQSRSPVYSVHWPYDREEVRKDALESLQKEEEKVWIAFKNGRVVGYQFFLPIKSKPGLGMVIPDQCTFLGFAVTREDEQGRGIGRMLTAAGIAHDYEAGFTHCFTDWRATNLLSSRFWPRRGFRPAVYRLSRRLDERVLWAHGNPSAANWLAPNSPAMPFTVTQ